MTKELEKFLKDLYRSECRQTERYMKGLHISLTFNVIMLLVIITKCI